MSRTFRAEPPLRAPASRQACTRAGVTCRVGRQRPGPPPLAKAPPAALKFRTTATDTQNSSTSPPEPAQARQRSRPPCAGGLPENLEIDRPDLEDAMAGRRLAGVIGAIVLAVVAV